MREPLYPHVPKGKEPLFPHRPKVTAGKQRVEAITPTAKEVQVIEPFNIHLRAFWEDDMENVEKLIRKLDTNTLKKLYGMTIEVTPGQFFPNPRTGEPMLGDTWYFHGKPYLILLGTKPSPRVVYHEIAHAIGIEDEELAMKFAIEQEARLKSRGVTPTAEAAKEPLSNKEDAEIQNVLDSEYMQELKTGAWKKQLNEMTDGRYLVEVYWVPWISEVGREEQWERYFTDQSEAEKFYQSLKTIAQVRKQMNRFSFPP